MWFRGLYKLFIALQPLLNESLGNYTRVLSLLFCHTASTFFSNRRPTSLVLTCKTRHFTAKQKQIGLQNYLEFGPVNVSTMKLFVKALKVQKFASTSLQKWQF